MHGTAGGKFGTSQTLDALTLTPVTPSGAQALLTPNGTSSLAFMVQNNSGVQEDLTGASITGTVSTSVPGCASHVTFNGAALGGGYGPGTTGPVEATNALTADGSLPAACAGADITVTLSGSTTP
jgi:hypothetical protein